MPFPRGFSSCIVLLATFLMGCPDSGSTVETAGPSSEKEKEKEKEQSAGPAVANPSPVREPGPAFQRFAMPGVQGLIVGESEAGAFYAALTGDTSPSYFTPEKSQIIDLETRLPPFIRTKAKAGSRLRKDLSAFRRQYMGIHRDDTQLVFVQLFCETNRRDWTRKPILAGNTEDCFFQIEFNPATRTFSRLVSLSP